MPERKWTCRRQQGGVVCGTENPARKRNCTRCQKPRQRRETSKTRHMAVLRDLQYEWWVEQFGEQCGICGAGPVNKRLQRDHDHKTGEPRALLCYRCNKFLHDWMTPEWLVAAAEYVLFNGRGQRERKGTSTDGDHS